MTQTVAAKDWLETVPEEVKGYVLSLEGLATTALENNYPYHSLRIPESLFDDAGVNAGRLPSWCIAITAKVGWEYENATCDRKGVMWLMFKNPYVFS